MNNPEELLPPGFRFHPTDEELILHYLKNRAASLPCPVSIIAEVDIYKFDPWDLPAKAAFGDKEWYFFSPRDRKYPNGVRPNRAAGSGYWKATGTDKPISTMRSGKSESIGVKKALVFYRGKPPKGRKTSWIMHEYRLSDTSNANANIHLRYSPPLKQKEDSMRLDDWVLCRIYEKTGNHAGPSPVDDHLDMVSSLDMVSPFTNLGSHQNRVLLQQLGMQGELFTETDYNVLSRLLRNPPEVAVQVDQINPEFYLGSAVGHPFFDGGSSSSIGNDLARDLQHVEQPVLLTGDQDHLKRQRVSGVSGAGEEDSYPNLKGFVSFVNTPIHSSQSHAINQTYHQLGFE